VELDIVRIEVLFISKVREGISLHFTSYKKGFHVNTYCALLSANLMTGWCETIIIIYIIHIDYHMHFEGQDVDVTFTNCADFTLTPNGVATFS